jgi:hypothetical protein
MKWMIIFVFTLALGGCVTSSEHTKKTDLVNVEFTQWLELYFAEDADTETKKFYASKISNIKNKFEKLANEDPSLKVDISQAGGLVGMGGPLGTGISLLLMGAAWYRKNKQQKNLIDDLANTPDSSECLRKIHKVKNA